MLPIAERELRVAARHPRTHRSRLAMAGLGVLIFGWMVWLMVKHGRGISGTDLFQTLSWIAHFYCSFAGVALSADCLSVEKRENTVGLLFLTHLKGFEIVFGKLMASSLNCVFGLLAMFPVLAIPLMMGGVQLADFGRVVLSLLNTLFLSLSVGMLVSSVSKHAVRATSLALLLMLFANFGLTGISELLRVHYQLPDWAHALELASPFFVHRMAESNAVWLRTNFFWPALLTTHLIAWACLGFACWILPRIWKEKAGGKASYSWRTRWRRWKFGIAQGGGGIRSRLLDFNPFFWLASRDRLGRLAPLLFVVVFVIAATWVSSTVGQHFFGPAKPIGGFVFAWFWATGLLHVIVLLRVAMAATHQFAEDRKSGALELLLATPLRSRQIVRGQWLALLRQMWGPMCAAILFHALFVWGLAELFAAEEFPGRTGLGLLWDLWKNGLAKSARVDWHFIFMLFVVLAAGGLVAANWVALGWVGMWMGLKAKRARNAPWAALALVLIPPVPIFTLAVMTLDQFSFLWTEYELLYLGLNIAIGLSLLNSAALSFWAWHKLRREFRIAVTDRSLFLLRRRSWRQRGKLCFRFVLGAAAALVLIKLWHVEENWRGRRAWDRFKLEIEAKGEKLDLASLNASEAPSDQEFGQAPIFAPLFNLIRSTHGGYEWRSTEIANLQAIGLQMQSQGPWAVRSPQLGDWRNQASVSLTFWQKHLRSLPQFARPAGTNEPAADILAALSKFSPQLEAMHEASRLPGNRFPIDYANVQNGDPPHLHILQNIADVLELRALASLSVSRAEDAFRDLKLILRFAEALSQEAFLNSQQRRVAMVGAAVQIVWEGLSNRRWTDAQLADIEQHLQTLDLTADFPKTIRSEMILQFTAWDRLRATIDSETPPDRWSAEGRWRSLQFFYPIGWSYHRQIQVYRLHEDLQRKFANRGTPAVGPEDEWEIWDSIERNGAFLDNRNFRWTLQTYSQESSRTQIAVHFARVACAIERHRLAQGEYPERLESLVPQFLAKLPPNDPGNDAMTYRRLDDGRIVLTIVRRNTIWRSSWVETHQWRYPNK